MPFYGYYYDTAGGGSASFGVRFDSNYTNVAGYTCHQAASARLLSLTQYGLCTWINFVSSCLSVTSPPL